MTQVLLSQISVPELVTLLADAVVTAMNQTSAPPPDQHTPESKRLYGDNALAQYVGCSVLTIRKMKAKLPRYQTGRKFYYESAEIDEFFRVNPRKK